MSVPSLKSQNTEIYYFYVKKIEITGNKITHESVIFRELEFVLGDSLTAFEINEALKKSENNLLNTSLFNFAELRYRIVGFEINVSIELTERWYIWPAPILEVGERSLPAWLKNPDWNKLNYGTLIYWYNFRGRNETLKSKIRFGYKQQFSLEYSTPNLDKNKKHGLNVRIEKFRQHELILRNENDKPVYFQTNDRYIYESFSSIVTYIFRPHLYYKYSLSIGYNKHLFSDDANREEYLGIEKGGLEFFDLEYVFENDKRDNKIYPLHGYLFRAGVYHRGLHLISDFQFQKNYLNLIGSLHSEIKPRLFLENHGKLQLTKDESLPNLFEKAIGYENYLRGFEHYTINGNGYSILLNNIKYCLVQPNTFYIPTLGLNQFNKAHMAIYMNLFFDMAYVDGEFVSEGNNSLPDNLLYSMGIGIDLVSYYDQVLRLDFTLNSLNEPGLYLHLETPFRRWFRQTN